MIREAIRWELLMPDGRVIEGEGQDAPAGMKLTDLAKDALHARFTHPAGTVVYVAGPASLRWTIQNIHSFGKRGQRFLVEHGVKPTTKALGIAGRGDKLNPATALLVWIMPLGAIGIGGSVEHVEAAWNAFNVAKTR